MRKLTKVLSPAKAYEGEDYSTEVSSEANIEDEIRHNISKYVINIKTKNSSKMMKNFK